MIGFGCFLIVTWWKRTGNFKTSLMQKLRVHHIVFRRLVGLYFKGFLSLLMASQFLPVRYNFFWNYLLSSVWLQRNSARKNRKSFFKFFLSTGIIIEVLFDSLQFCGWLKGDLLLLMMLVIDVNDLLLGIARLHVEVWWTIWELLFQASCYPYYLQQSSR